MKVKNTKIIQFNLKDGAATLYLKKDRNITVDSDSLFAQSQQHEVSDYILIQNGRSTPLPERTVVHILKYLEYSHRDKQYDYYKIPFTKLTETMTQDEFDNTKFNSKTIVTYKGEAYRVHSVDFEERLIGIKVNDNDQEANESDTELTWVRCENCIKL